MNITTLKQLLTTRANDMPDFKGYYLLNDSIEVAQSVTYLELYEQSKAVASYLMSTTEFQEPVVLMYENSIDFVVAFLACSLSGRIAVPVYNPITMQAAERLKHIMHKSGASLILSHQTVSSYLKKIKIVERIETATLLSKYLNSKYTGEVLTYLNEYAVIDTTQIFDDGDSPSFPEINEDHICFLQFTSGSTAAPKGIIVTHKNVMCNQKSIKKAFNVHPQTKSLSWLPVSHDMGLITNVIQPLFSAYSVHLMTPFQFIKNPLLWVKALFQYEITGTGGSNFAYDLCTHRLERKPIDYPLDLSGVEIFYNGAEPIHQDTLNLFINAFAPYGVSKKQIYPCYGLAEATLLVACKPFGDSIYNTINLDKSLFHKNKIKLIDKHKEKDSKQPTTVLVSVGRVSDETEVIILNATTNLPCAPDEVGEVLLRGDNVTQGIWKNHEVTHKLFKTINGRSFLHTGDLGFFHDDELYITGRVKDCIIINGNNYYPHDLEFLALSTAKGVGRKGGAVAFSVEHDNTEGAVLVIETSEKDEDILSEAEAKIKKALVQVHQIQLYDLLFVPTKTLLKTTSGKLQRSACKQRYLNFIKNRPNHQEKICTHF